MYTLHCNNLFFSLLYWPMASFHRIAHHPLGFFKCIFFLLFNKSLFIFYFLNKTTIKFQYCLPTCFYLRFSRTVDYDWVQIKATLYIWGREKYKSVAKVIVYRWVVNTYTLLLTSCFKAHIDRGTTAFYSDTLRFRTVCSVS